MNIIIVGCGKIGTALAMYLSKENHNITVIDKSRRALENVVNSYDAVGYEGNGASASLLKKADIQNADLLIAMTGNDELNVMCCLVARKIGHCRTIARVTNPDYQNELGILKEELGLALVVNPDSMVAGEIARRSRGTPRIANALLRRVRDFAQVKGDGTIDLEIAQYALEALNIDTFGLDQIDNKLLLTIIDKFRGGPVGLNTIATAMGEDAGTIEDVYEPYLIKEGFIKRTPRGRLPAPRQDPSLRRRSTEFVLTDKLAENNTLAWHLT